MSTITLQTIAVRSQACIKFSHQAVASLLILNILWKNVLKKKQTAQKILVSALLFHALAGFAMWIVNACTKFKLLLWSFVTRAVYANKKKKNQSLQWHRMCIGGYCTVAWLTVSCTKKKKGGELFTQCKALINVHAVCSSALSWYTNGKQNEKKKLHCRRSVYVVVCLCEHNHPCCLWGVVERWAGSKDFQWPVYEFVDLSSEHLELLIWRVS